MPLLVVAIIAAIIIGAGYHFITRGYREEIPNLNSPAPRVIGFFGRDFGYNPDDRIAEGRFTEARIFDHHIDRYNGEDYISGTAGKTRFECSEVHAEYKTTSTDSKGNSHTEWHTIFKGLFLIADFNKNFNGLTLVLPDVAQAEPSVDFWAKAAGMKHQPSRPTGKAGGCGLREAVRGRQHRPDRSPLHPVAGA